MYTGLYAAVSGSLAHEKRLAILTNNLANANTVGFKADRPVFQIEPLPDVAGPSAPGRRPRAGYDDHPPRGNVFALVVVVR